MGFYITGDDDYSQVDGLKQHLNLSDGAWEIILGDINNFYFGDNKGSFSGFLNTIFTNFHSEANAAISQRYANRKNELESLFKSKKFSGIDDKIKSLFISELLDTFVDNLLTKAKFYQRGPGKKFRINKSNLDLLRNSNESIYYEDSIGEYLKAIYEEYSLLPTYLREQIFFKSHISTIKNAIKDKNKLKVITSRKYNVNKGQFYLRSFYISPLEILNDKSNSFNYLIGYSEEINTDGTLRDKVPISFRISRIHQITQMKSLNAFITIKDKKNLKDEVDLKGVQFLAGEIENIIIRFTKKGLEVYDRTLYMRPNYSKYLGDNTYLFETTYIQALNYFLKLGRDIEILEPKYIREAFIKRYQSALDVYKD